MGSPAFSVEETVKTEKPVAEDTFAPDRPVIALSDSQDEGADPLVQPDSVSSSEEIADNAQDEAASPGEVSSGGVSPLTAEDVSADASFLPQKDVSLGLNAEEEARLLEMLGDEEFELIFQVRRRRRLLSASSVGIQRGLTYYFPMVEIARLAQINMESNIAEGVVNGFFIRENSPYRLDATAGTYTTNGETKAIPEGAIIVRDLGMGLGDIYASLDLLNSLWDLDLDFDFSNLTLNINTSKLLPDDLKEKRNQKRALFDLKDDPGFSGLVLEHIPNRYRVFTPPAINLAGRVRWNGARDSYTNTLNVSGENDFLGTRANYNLGLQREQGEAPEVRNARLRFTRREYGNESLPFGLQLFEAGDVNARPSDLIDSSIGGRGVVLSNRPLRKPSTFDEIIVEGLAQPGWEVELYHNKRLIDYGVVDGGGEYRFENVPLNFGNNTIRIVLYGPQGQIEERIERYPINGKMLVEGQTTFETSVVDSNRNLFEVNDRLESEPKGITYQARVDRGISDWISAFATLTSTPTDVGDKNYATVGANLAGLGGVGQVEAYKDLQGGSALDVRYLSNFAGLRVNMRGSVFSDFESEEVGYGDSAKTMEGEARFSSNFKLPQGSLGLNLNFLHTKYENDRQRTSVRNGVSVSRKGVRVSNNLTTDLVDKTHQKTAGDLNIHTNLSPRWTARARLDYDVFPDKLLDTGQLELRYRDGKNFTGAFEVTRDLQDQSTRFGANAAYDFGTFLAGIDANWNRNDGFSVGVRTNTSLGPYGDNNSYIASSKSMTGRQRVRGRIFHDTNNDGVFDENDEPLEGAKFKVNYQRSEEADAEGNAVVPRAGPNGPAVVTLDEDSLDNPFMAPATDGYSTVIRPTTYSPVMDFPVVMTGTIDGNVYFPDGTPVPGLIMQLVDEKGQVVQDTATFFDGFYTFEYVKPGTYTVQVSPSHQVSVSAETVTVTSSELFAYGVDFHLVEQGEDESVAAEADGVSGRVAQNYHAPVTEETESPAPPTPDGRFETVVRAVRFGEHPHKVRLVLDLSGPAGYQISSENGGYNINIDLPSTAWDAMNELKMQGHAFFEGYQALSLPDGGGTRLRLNAKDPVEVFYNAAIPPDNGHGYRVYVDFIKTK